MSFYQHYLSYSTFDFDGFFSHVKEEDILRVLNKNRIHEMEFLTLLSPKAEKFLEEMAQKAYQLTLQHFGKTILLFTPMYLSNYCVNRCLYCSFNMDHDIKREKLTLQEIEEEAKGISETGIRHILLLTGESRKETPVRYIINAVEILKNYFDSISIEIYPLTEEEYQQMIEAGVDGLTIYQEVYDEEKYQQVHPYGPKRNYLFRLDAPERACKAQIRNVTVGALLGLSYWRKEAFFTGLHAYYLQNTFNHVGVNVSLPRIRPHIGGFEEFVPVNDKNLVQNLLALRIFLPFAGITLSTRERQQLRDRLIYLGVTKMSAGVTTAVGGHKVNRNGVDQFKIEDIRSVDEMKKNILAAGYQPIFKDWMIL